MSVNQCARSIGALFLLTMACAVNVYATPYSNVVLAANPTTYWRLNETNGSTTAADMATNLPANTGAIVGTVTFGVPGAFNDDLGNTAMKDSASGYLHATNVEIGVSFSVEFWAKSATSNWNNYGNLLSARQTNGFLVHPWKDSASVTFFVYDQSNHFINAEGAGIDVPNPDQWHYYVMTYEDAAGSGTSKVYLDGKFVGAVPQTITRTAGTLLPHLYVGADGGAGSEFDGTIDEVAIYDHVLTVDEIQYHYASGKRRLSEYSRAVLADQPTSYWQLDEATNTMLAVDSATNLPVNCGSYAGAPTMGVTGGLIDDANNTAMSNNASGCMSAANVEIGASFSVEFWAKSATNQWNGYGLLMSSREANGFVVHAWPYGTDVRLYMFDTNASMTLVTSFSVTNDLTQWHYYAVTYADTEATDTAKMYLDGRLMAEANVSLARTADVLSKLDVGMDNGNAFQGTMDEAAVYSHALTADQILNHYKIGNNIHPSGTVIKIH